MCSNKHINVWLSGWRMMLLVFWLLSPVMTDSIVAKNDESKQYKNDLVNPDGNLWWPVVEGDMIIGAPGGRRYDVYVPVISFLSLGVGYDRRSDYYQHSVSEQSGGSSYEGFYTGYRINEYVHADIRLYPKRLFCKEALINPDGDLYWPSLEGHILLHGTNEQYGAFIMTFPLKRYFTAGLGLVFVPDYCIEYHGLDFEKKYMSDGGVELIFKLYTGRIFNQDSMQYPFGDLYWPQIEYMYSWVKPFDAQGQDHSAKVVIPITTFCSAGIGYKVWNDCFYWGYNEKEDAWWGYKQHSSIMANFEIYSGYVFGKK